MEEVNGTYVQLQFETALLIEEPLIVILSNEKLNKLIAQYTQV